eukprot:CAMPEP_0202865920 /NCGR_PEP_ID=MMETSP1391-20130828/6681_1 /ASSEMBLY_ACC=CAM_ASM_000867 /TAXON_ID=1034604 /ORGANISM="Chlamydomonas leiostraca, Strain SAG 11-49" /LENGTH=479 /DNA_ID=CAMNT_0049545811 /DNA_START=43 /DNA_END=1482 /DNA_ORIENTATION=-
MWRGKADPLSQSLQRAFAADPAKPDKQDAEQHNSAFAHARASFEVPDDVEQLRAKLQTSRFGSTNLNNPKNSLLANVEGFKRPSLPVPLPDHEAYENWRKAFPCVLKHLGDIKLLLKGKRLAVFLDYDGTLTPIVSNPDEALMSQEMRAVVRSLAQLFPTAIISGRGREKVENFVQLKELYYAGSHGMDIAGPSAFDGEAWSTSVDSTFQPAAHFRPLIDTVYHDLCARLASIPGSSVEHNTFCVSAHFRNCEGEAWQDVVAAVEQVVAANPELRMTRGRKVVEVRPKVNWHKGTALDHLLGVLGLRDAPDVVALYIGDDHTDEDAFRTLRDAQQGFGILVSTKVKDTTAARYTVRDPDEVQAFLEALVAWGRTDDNGWRHAGAGGRSSWPPQSQGALTPASAVQGSPQAVAGAASSSKADSKGQPLSVATSGGSGRWLVNPPSPTSPGAAAAGNGGMWVASAQAGGSSSTGQRPGPAG